MKAKSINPTALLLKTLLLAGFIIFTNNQGFSATYYRIGTAAADYNDATKWSTTSSSATPVGTGTFTWTSDDIMVFNALSNGASTTKFPENLTIAGLVITNSKTVSISVINVSSPCYITLSGASPINIATESTLNFGSSYMTLDISPTTSNSSGSIYGNIQTSQVTGIQLKIGQNAIIDALGFIKGYSTNGSIASLTVSGTFATSNYIKSADLKVSGSFNTSNYIQSVNLSISGNFSTTSFVQSSTLNIAGTFNTSSYVNCTYFQLENTGSFETSYASVAEGWWLSTGPGPTDGYILGDVIYSCNSTQIITGLFVYAKDIIFNGSTKILPGNVNCNGNLTINNSASVVVNSTASLNVSGTLTNNTGASGLVLKSDADGTASLLHTTTGVDATVERYIGIDPYNWHFLSSPVIDQPIWPEFAPDPEENGGTWGEYDPDSPYNWDFYYFNPNALTTSELYWVNLRKPDGSYNNGQVMLSGSLAGYGSGTPSFFTGRGYLVAYGDGWSTALTDINIHTFTGTLNEGDITYDIVNSANAYNLIGNPYPSSIDWDSEEDLPFWTRSGAIAASGLGYDYYVWDEGVTGNYIYRNSASGLGDASNYISPGQGFFVKADANGGTLTFRDGIRVNTTESVFVKSTDVKNNYIRLKFTSSANSYHDEMFVEFNEQYSGLEGTDKFWSFYTEAPELYSVKDGNNYSIDRYNALTDDMKVDIAAKTGVAATYTITATNIADFTLRDKVYLLDLKTGVKTNLKQTPSYTFAGTPDDDRNRFQLIFGTSIGVDEETSSDITIYASENIIYIRNDKANEPYTVMVSNMLGQIITRTKLAGNTLNQIELNSVPGVYVVTVYSEGSLFSKKVVVK